MMLFKRMSVYNGNSFFLYFLMSDINVYVVRSEHNYYKNWNIHFYYANIVRVITRDDAGVSLLLTDLTRWSRNIQKN